MNFQITVLKILVSYPDGWAHLDDLKRDMALLATSGKDWSDRTKRLGAKVPELSIFAQGLVGRVDGGWRITSDGRELIQRIDAPVSLIASDEGQDLAPLAQAHSKQRSIILRNEHRARTDRRRRLKNRGTPR